MTVKRICDKIKHDFGTAAAAQLLLGAATTSVSRLIMRRDASYTVKGQ